MTQRFKSELVEIEDLTDCFIKPGDKVILTKSISSNKNKFVLGQLVTVVETHSIYGHTYKDDEGDCICLAGFDCVLPTKTINTEPPKITWTTLIDINYIPLDIDLIVYMKSNTVGFAHFTKSKENTLLGVINGDIYTKYDKITHYCVVNKN
ncbi:MAG: hypothetical protein RSE41_00060 [Clostridia bacterium]